MSESNTPVEDRLRKKLAQALTPVHMELVNESHMHNVAPGSEMHFKLVIASPVFAGMSMIEQQRKVNEVIAGELAGPVHAFSQFTFTPEQWEKTKGSSVSPSPECLGGGKHDNL